MRYWAALVLGGLAVATASADIYSRAYGPRGALMLRKPQLLWQVRADGGQTIANVWAKVNGESVVAKYDAKEGVAYVDFQAPLTAGPYRVEMGAEADDGLSVKKKWDFTVAGEAILEPPAVSQRQSEAFSTLNAFRASIGEPPAVPNPSMFAAAQFHADYLVANNTTGHIQQPGTPKFFGATPTERLNAFGFIDSNYEVVHYGSASLESAVANLVAAPYHRIPFLTPGRIEIGAGYADERFVALFGMNREKKAVTYPTDGQRDVPTMWNQRERPNPLRIHPGLEQPVGYPVMLSYFTPDDARISLKFASIVEELSGAPVDCVANHPGNDGELTSSVFLMPRKPLRPNTAYRATFECTLDSGERIFRAFVFHTGAK